MLATRKTFIQSLGSLIIAGIVSRSDLQAASTLTKELHIASNQYPWFTFFNREGRKWEDNIDRSLGEFVKSGIPGYEPIINSAAEVQVLGPFLQKHSLQMRSLYVNSILHEKDGLDNSILQVITIAKAARPLGVKIIVTNPSPIKWGGTEDKTDRQLETQANALNRLGEELNRLGLVLAYHTHDAEMRNAAREFHHMMLSTQPKYVSLCLDAHWIYRGSGNSQVALFDIVRLYGKRITELHLRQSKDGIWTEVFEDGDIDYKRLAEELLSMNVRPHLVLEQSVEKQSGHTLDAVSAHKKSMVYATRLLASFVK